MLDLDGDGVSLSIFRGRRPTSATASCTAWTGRRRLPRGAATATARSTPARTFGTRRPVQTTPMASAPRGARRQPRRQIDARTAYARRRRRDADRDGRARRGSRGLRRSVSRASASPRCRSRATPPATCSATRCPSPRASSARTAPAAAWPTSSSATSPSAPAERNLTATPPWRRPDPARDAGREARVPRDVSGKARREAREARVLFSRSA